MPNFSIDYGAGHTLQDNGVGDWDLTCPILGIAQFVPFMIGLILEDRRCKCGWVFHEQRPTDLSTGKTS